MTENVKLIPFDTAMDLAQAAGGKRHILLGNGFSIGAHERFRYGSLYEQARQAGLPKHVEALFDRYGTANFEDTLRHLREGHWLAKHYRLTMTDPNLDMDRDYAKVKEALVSAIATAHPAKRSAVSDEKLEACAGFLEQFNNVFTTNYDLLLYWASLARAPFPFKDGFWNSDGDPNYLVFDAVPLKGSNTRFIYFLHGALHLYSEGGDIRKIVWRPESQPLIDQIRMALSEDRFRLPLVVSEGASRHKEEHIGGNPYRSACRRSFQTIEGTLFVLGSSLGPEDKHILRWISQNQKLRQLYVGVHGDPRTSRNRAMISRILDQPGPAPEYETGDQSGRILFYDSRTANVWGSDGDEGTPV